MKYFSYISKRAYLACFTCNMSVVNVCIDIYTHRVTLIDTQNVELRGSIIHRYMCIYI